MNQQISVGVAVGFQLHEGDLECNNGQGTIINIAGNIAEIKPAEHCSSLESVHRYIDGEKLIIKKP